MQSVFFPSSHSKLCLIDDFSGITHLKRRTLRRPSRLQSSRRAGVESTELFPLRICKLYFSCCFDLKSSRFDLILSRFVSYRVSEASWRQLEQSREPVSRNFPAILPLFSTSFCAFDGFCFQEERGGRRDGSVVELHARREL